MPSQLNLFAVTALAIFAQAQEKVNEDGENIPAAADLNGKCLQCVYWGYTFCRRDDTTWPVDDFSERFDAQGFRTFEQRNTRTDAFTRSMEVNNCVAPGEKCEPKHQGVRNFCHCGQTDCNLGESTIANTSVRQYGYGLFEASNTQLENVVQAETTNQSIRRRSCLDQDISQSTLEMNAEWDQGHMPNNTIILGEGEGCHFKVTNALPAGADEKDTRTMGGFNFMFNENQDIDILITNTTAWSETSTSPQAMYELDRAVAGRVAIKQQHSYQVLLINKADSKNFPKVSNDEKAPNDDGTRSIMIQFGGATSLMLGATAAAITAMLF